MTREEAILSLIRLEQPLDVVRAALRAYKWDWDEVPVARLDGRTVADVLNRYIAGELAPDDLQLWANLLEGREDVDFAPEAAAAIFDLANPELQGPLTIIVPALLARL